MIAIIKKVSNILHMQGIDFKEQKEQETTIALVFPEGLRDKVLYHRLKVMFNSETTREKATTATIHLS